MNPKIEKLEQEREDNITKIQKYELKKEQLEHQLARAENKERFLSKKERDRRTHQLCNIGGAVEHFFPEAKNMTREQFYNFMEHLSQLPEVERLLSGIPGGE